GAILERARDLQRQLTDAGETSPDLMHSEVLALDELVRTLLVQGDTKAALAAAERSRDIMAALLAGTDGGDRNPGWRKDLSVTYQRIGEVLLAIGRREEALAAYRMALATLEELAAADPANFDAQRGLSIACHKIGDALVEAGQADEALELYRRSLAIDETLLAANPR